MTQHGKFLKRMSDCPPTSARAARVSDCRGPTVRRSSASCRRR